MCSSHALATRPGTLAVLERVGGFATTAQLLTVMTRQQLDNQVKSGRLVRVWYGIYAAQQPNLLGRLAALDIFISRNAVACLGTAAAPHGFDTENTSAVHILNPGVRMRPPVGLMVHQRNGAALQRVAGRLATAPAWTAVEVARQLRRPRAPATLDAALRSMRCTRDDIARPTAEQRVRRGIVAVRELLPFADGRAESAMESETRLVMIDGGLPQPELQYLIHGRDGESWRVDFAWPEVFLAAEYESIAWHAGAQEMLRDKTRRGEIQELGWTIVPIVVDNVRSRPDALVRRIEGHLNRARMAR